MIINQIYGGGDTMPTDGNTHLIINIAAEGRMTVPLYIYQSVANGVSIDWGDGSAAQTLAGTGYVNTTHTYADIGRYDITLTVADGCTLGFGSGTSAYCVLGETTNSTVVYCNMLRAVHIGTGVTSIVSHAFRECGMLTSVVIPDSVTSIGNYAFSYCHALASVVMPNSVTSIGNYAFYYCYSLTNVVFPQGMTSIGDNAFQTCTGAVIYDFSACASVPTLASTSVFANIPSDCIMKIPSALFTAWSTATNWSAYASYMVAV